MSNPSEELRRIEAAKQLKIAVAQSMGYLSNEQIRVLAEAFVYSSSGGIYNTIVSMLPAEDQRFGIGAQAALAKLKLDSTSSKTWAIVLAGIAEIYADGEPDEKLIHELIGGAEDISWRQVIGGLLGGGSTAWAISGIQKLVPQLATKGIWGALVAGGLIAAGAAVGYASETADYSPPKQLTLKKQ